MKTNSEISLDFLKNKAVLVTGGTGSFGKSFVKFLLENTAVQKVIVFSRDEYKQSKMQEEIKDQRLRFFLGDIRDLQRLERAFNGVNIVVHAAALKQVPTLEYNPFEAVKTNIIGSQNVVDAAIDKGVEKVLLISTDKAAQPVNLYGSTKLCAEKLFINGNSYASGRTKFSCVRYGNVIGSRGSIVDVLLNYRPGEKVCLTDERMTRFWMTLEQSHALVVYALKNMVGGEIYIPKMPSMKLVDMFEALVPDAERKIIGIRPGEKLDEILLTVEESRHAVGTDNYYIILPEDTYIFNPEKYSELIKRSQKLSADFTYCSHINNDWITVEDLKKIIKQT